jgi:predicted phage terminase large subunit-like protein
MVALATSLKAVRERASVDFLYFRCHILKREFLAGNPFQEGMTAFVAKRGGKPIKLLRVPRGHGKTTAVIDWLTWRISLNRNERILISGPTHDHSKGILNAIKTIAEKNRMLRDVFCDAWPEDPANECPWWTRERIELPRDIFDKNPTISTAGVDSGTTGSHYSIIVLDDQVNNQNYQTQVLRENVWTHTLNCHALMDDRPGQPAEMLYSNTPWHPQDATMRLTSTECSFADDIAVFEQSVYRSGKLDPIESDDVIWPEFRSPEFIRKQRAKPMRFFSPHYLMKPLPEGEHPFNKDKLLPFVLEYKVNAEQVACWEHPQKREYYIHMAVDTNTNVDTAADPCAIMVWAKDHARHMWALDKRRMIGCTTPQLLDAILRMYQKWRPLSLMIEFRGKEDRFVYEVLQHGLRNGVGYPLHRLTRGGRTGKAGKYARIIPMAVAVDEGMFHVPKDGNWQEFTEEMDYFSETCDHDDMMDCTADIYTYGRWPLEPKVEEKERPPQDPHLMRALYGANPSPGVRLYVPRSSRMLV